MSSELAQKYFDLQKYVDWTPEDQQRVLEVSNLLLANRGPLIEDFYEEIQAHAHTREILDGRAEQITRLKATLGQWLQRLLLGPYDQDYVVLRSHIGRRHVEIGLDQIYVNAGLARLRSKICESLSQHWTGSPRELILTTISLNKLLDLDLAIIEDAYQAEYLARHQSLSKENLQLRVALDRRQKKAVIVGESEPMQEVYRLIARTGPTNKPILIQGESGTGKELVAAALHRSSRLADKPLVAINCAALSESLLESELFGHEKGAFTGATSSKPGLFEVADGGTLFIDEIGELAGILQIKLLRVLEDGSLRRVGSVQERRVNVRLLAATNRDLAQDVATGRFREDLYYRINVLTINLPPLRLRPADIPLLVKHFAPGQWKWDETFGDTLQRYSWPGNVRQLRNALDRAKVLAEDEWLQAENLPAEILRSTEEISAAPPADNSDLDTINRYHITSTFQRCQGNKARTARALGISRRTLYRLLEKHDIDLLQTKS